MKKLLNFVDTYFKLVIMVCVILITVCYVKVSFEEVICEQNVYLGEDNDTASGEL